MIAIGIILILLMTGIISCLTSIDNKLDVMIKHQNELIKAIKNSKK